MRLVTRLLPAWLSRRGGRLCFPGFCGMLAVFVVGCQYDPPPPPPTAPSFLQEPRFLPTLPPARMAAQAAEQRRAFAAAEALRGSRQYIQARHMFNDFVRDFPTSPLASAALLALGYISLTLEQYDQAALYYRALLERFPAAEHEPEAALGLGIALYHQQEYAQSLLASRRYLARRPSGPDQGLAFYYSGVAELKLQHYVEGIAALKHAAALSPVLAVTKRAQDLIAGALHERLSVDMLQTLAKQYAREYPGDLVLERLAQLYRATGDHAAEAEVLQRLTTAFPQTPTLPEARQRLQSLRAQVPAERLKLGVLFPLSGPGGRAGTRALRGVELAVAMLQEDEPGLQLSLVTRDATQSTAVAREALRAMVHTDRVIGVIGPLLSRMATELAPLMDQLGVPVLSPYARDSTFPALSAYAFRNSLTDAMQGRFLAEYAIGTLRLQRFVVLYPDDPYGLALREHFEAQVRQRQGEIVAVIAYDVKSTNIRPSLGRLQGLQYDAIFLPEYADKVGVIVRQLVNEGIKEVQLLGADAWNAPALLASEPHLLEGAVFVDGFFAQASAPLVKTFVEQFRARYQETPDLLAAQAYDSLAMCAQVWKAGARTAAQLREGLMRIRNFAGVSGRTSIGVSRDAEKVPYFLTVQRGQIVQLQVPVAAAR